MLFSKPKRLRLNVMMDADIVDTLDSFAILNGSSRSHVLNELLRPSMPALQELLELSHHMKNNPDSIPESIESLDKLEEQLNKPVEQIPAYIKGISK